MVINLSGLSNNNSLNLTGKSHSIYKSSNYAIEKFKKRILANYIIPLYSKQWDILTENIFFIDKLLNQAKLLNKSFKNDELNVYVTLLKMIKICIEEHNILVVEETKNKFNTDPNDFTSMFVKMPKIRLLPEYEIYNSILGKPDRLKNEFYDEEIISIIKSQMNCPDITYKKIKETLLKSK
jgi:hypothetical protein